MRDDVGDLAGGEGDRQDVKAAEVEDLRPETLVGQTGGDDETRRPGQLCGLLEHAAPVAVGQFGGADEYGQGLAARGEEGLRNAGDGLEAPTQAVEGAAQGEAVGGDGTGV